jgi:chromosome segregation ATPase
VQLEATAAEAEVAAAPEPAPAPAPAPAAISAPVSTATAIAGPPPRATPHARPEPSAPGGGAKSKGEPTVSAPEPVASDVLSRKDRLEKIKRKVAEASRPAVRPAPAPADPARAAESVLGLVRDLEIELVRAREREDALKADLEDAKKELGRTAADGRGAAERLAAAEKELEEKRGVLAELLAEMQALEDERDESVRRAQALASLDEERARLLEEITHRAEEEARLRAEREAEVERLSEELRAGAQEGARLRAAVGELARERDQLAGDLERTRAERDELGTAKRALEQVHAALAQARARIG